jgi:hypothetical protein
VYTLWQLALRHASAATRPDLLWDLPMLLPMLLRLGDQGAALETVRSIREVGQRWP